MSCPVRREKGLGQSVSTLKPWRTDVILAGLLQGMRSTYLTAQLSANLQSGVPDRTAMLCAGCCRHILRHA